MIKKEVFSRYYYTSVNFFWLIDKAIHTHPVQIPFGQTSINCVAVEYALITLIHLFRQINKLKKHYKFILKKIPKN